MRREIIPLKIIVRLTLYGRTLYCILCMSCQVPASTAECQGQQPPPDGSADGKWKQGDDSLITGDVITAKL